ncbi:MAG: alpha/beta hydrolase [Chloroflexi bacterium]|nr:alpha/beta hydrolase [Chloroflexota bacterium]
MAAMETSIVQASDRVGLAVHRFGTGSPLYAVHAGPAADHQNFGNYLTSISGCRELLLLDQRGCGQSEDAPVESYTIDRLSEDVEDVRRRLGHEKIDLLAHSFGGVIAVDYARRWPDRVRALVLVDAAASGWYGPLIEPRGWSLWWRTILSQGRSDSDWLEFHLTHEVANRAKKEEVRELLSTEMRYDEARVRPLVSASMRRVRLETLAKQVAIFGIYGRQDRRFMGDARYLDRVGATVAFIDNAGHFPFVEQPEAFHHALRQFLGC